MRKELRSCRSDVVRRRLESIRLTKLGYERQVIAEVLGVSVDTVRRTVAKFNEVGFAGIVEDKRANNGRKPALTAEQEGALRDALKGRAPDGGLWNGRKVGAWLSSTFGIVVGKRLGWATLRRLDFSLQRPQRHHVKGDLTRQEEFQKNSRALWLPSAPSTPPSPSSSGHKTKRGSASTPSSDASGRRRANGQSQSSTLVTSGSTSTASSGPRPVTSSGS
jgi:transposase